MLVYYEVRIKSIKTSSIAAFYNARIIYRAVVKYSSISVSKPFRRQYYIEIRRYRGSGSSAVAGGVQVAATMMDYDCTRMIRELRFLLNRPGNSWENVYPSSFSVFL